MIEITPIRLADLRHREERRKDNGPMVETCRPALAAVLALQGTGMSVWHEPGEDRAHLGIELRHDVHGPIATFRGLKAMGMFLRGAGVPDTATGAAEDLIDGPGPLDEPARVGHRSMPLSKIVYAALTCEDLARDCAAASLPAVKAHALAAIEDVRAADLGAVRARMLQARRALDAATADPDWRERIKEQIMGLIDSIDQARTERGDLPGFVRL